MGAEATPAPPQPPAEDLREAWLVSRVAEELLVDETIVRRAIKEADEGLLQSFLDGGACRGLAEPLRRERQPWSVLLHT